MGVKTTFCLFGSWSKNGPQRLIFECLGMALGGEILLDKVPLGSGCEGHFGFQMLKLRSACVSLLPVDLDVELSATSLVPSLPASCRTSHHGGSGLNLNCKQAPMKCFSS